MADISQEVEAFRNAKEGRDVRGSLISLAEKVNAEVEENTSDITTAITEANTAADNANQKAALANTATGSANTAALNANNAAVSAAATRQDILDRLAAGEFKGDKGDTGDTGPQGESGVMVPLSGMFSVSVDSATGNFYAYYPEEGTPPPLQYDSETGNFYLITD